MSKKTSGFIILAVIIIAAGSFLLLKPKAEPRPQLESILGVSEALAEINTENVHPLIADAFKDTFSLDISGDIEQSFRRAEAELNIHYLDAEALTAELAPEMQNLLAQYVYKALRPGDIYNEDKSFHTQLLNDVYAEALSIRLKDVEKYCRDAAMKAELKYSGGSWTMTNSDEIMNYSLAFCDEMPGFDEAAAELEYIDFHYRLRDWTSPGPMPDESCYGQCDEPAEILALLETDSAKKLINGQSLDFSAERDFIPGSPIHYYLDETILCIVWQEEEHGALATFAEVFIADASQLRRKLAGDSFGSDEFYFPTELARQSKAVLATGGDMYGLPDRVYGLYAYDGTLMRSALDRGQSCLFTDKGDMLFTYENQFASEEEAQAFIDENNVMFSLSFGPVMVENGVDVTPYSYPLGEVLDTYARAAIGQLGERHYLSMTINAHSPDYFVYVTLRQAADSMIEHGCINAYTLDGGQTGSIILGGELINPVQFGVERSQSDILYFATALQ